MRSYIRKRLRLRDDLSVSFYVIDFIFRKVLRQNAGVKWAVHHTSTINTPDKLIVGKNTFPGDSPNVWIDAINGISIGDYTNIGPNVSIVSANHHPINNAMLLPSNPIKIGKNNWIGSGAVILPGVILGDFTIVGAGAIVTKSFEDGYCIIAGNPAVIIQKLDKESCIYFARQQSK